MILQISVDAKQLILFSDAVTSHCTLPRKKKLAKTSKTGLKLDQKLLLIPSPELVTEKATWQDCLRHPRQWTKVSDLCHKCCTQDE